MYTAALSMHRHSALKLHHRPARPRSQCIDGPASFAVLQPLSAVAAHTAAMVVRNRGCDIASGSAVVTVQHICTCRIAKAQQRHSTTDGAADTRCCIPRDTPKYTWNSSVCLRATVNSERPLGKSLCRRKAVCSAIPALPDAMLASRPATASRPHHSLTTS